MMYYSATISSPVGDLKIQCTEEHITEVLFLKEGQEQLRNDHPLLHRCIGQLEEYFAGTRQQFDLPLKQEGSIFQQTVWNLLLTVPYGKTLSYHKLAAHYGDLKAIRAVAAANGRNKLAILVPCHRIIGSDHSLTGYAGGLWRKKWLLEHEARVSVGVEQMGLAFG